MEMRVHVPRTFDTYDILEIYHTVYLLVKKNGDSHTPTELLKHTSPKVTRENSNKMSS